MFFCSLRRKNRTMYAIKEETGFVATLSIFF